MKSPSLSQMLVIFLVLSLVFIVIERALGNSRSRPFFRRGWWTDVIYWFSTPLLKASTKLIVLPPLALLIAAGVTTAEVLKARAYTGFGPIGALPLSVQIVLIYLLADFIGYWSHRLLHRRRWWPFHAVHHSSQDLDWLGSVRVHPVNDLITNFVQVTPLLLLGFNPLATLSTAPVLTLYAIFLHANVDWDYGPLRSVIASPVFHRWHHSKDREAWDKNFAGLLPLWDILFGTYYMPKGRMPENFGIDDPMPESFLGQLWQPFIWVKAKRAQQQPDHPTSKP